MAALTIRDLDDAVTSAVAPRADLFSTLGERFSGVDLDLPGRGTPPRAADLPERSSAAYPAVR